MLSLISADHVCRTCTILVSLSPVSSGVSSLRLSLVVCPLLGCVSSLRLSLVVYPLLGCL